MLAAIRTASGIFARWEDMAKGGGRFRGADDERGRKLLDIDLYGLMSVVIVIAEGEVEKEEKMTRILYLARPHARRHFS